MSEECSNLPCCAEYKGNYEEVTSYFAVEKVPFRIIPGLKKGSRSRSKLAVRGTIPNPLIGLFYPGTHEVFEIPCCMLQDDKINQAVSLIKQWMIANHIAPYQEEGNRGTLRYIQCILERKTSTVQISLVLNTSDKSAGFDEAIQNLIEMCPPDFLHSIWINFNPSSVNVIFSPDWEHCYGKKWVEEEISGVPVCYLPGSFGQANLGMFEKLIDSIKKTIPSHKRVGEFYAGVGIIGLSVAPQSRSVILSESNPDSKICFDEMAKHLPEATNEKVSYRLSKTEKVLDILNEIDVAIVDPPRKGLDRSFISALTHSEVETLIYVSCGFPSLMRDLQLLKEKGWKITKAEGYPFFPGTPHIETLTLLERED
jgi:tRNA/tmRNA/rRNA uracil-C5-methylase (TrmA/RlmC/RlmD family)